MDRILLVSEYFPPAIGGSAELLANIYRRITADVDVLTTVRDGATDSADGQPMRVIRVPFPHGLGLFAPRAFADMYRLTQSVARLVSGGAVIYCGRALPEGTAAWLHWLTRRTPY